VRKTAGEMMLWIHSYGPFTIPKKESWVIVGSGPSATRNALESIDSHKGIVSLNGVISAIPRTDVHLVSHFEDYFMASPYFDKAKTIFIANPMHVGFRCLPVTAYQILDLPYYSANPMDIRFFEKDVSLESSVTRENTLYVESNIATAAVHLLHRNGVEEFETIGVDGGLGHSDAFPDVYYYGSVFKNSYEKGHAEFHSTIKKFGMKDKVYA